jgi:molybdate transport system substrate-binding protein
VGQYTQQLLDNAALDPAYGAAFREGLLANVASYEDNVKAVLAKVVLGEADAGIVYRSDISSENAGQIGQISIPAALNVSASYPIAALADSAQPELAQAFIDYILSEAGQEILAAHGFLPPESK